MVSPPGYVGKVPCVSGSEELFCAGDDRQYPRLYGHPGPADYALENCRYPVSHSEAEKALVEEKP
jgi:hypothetical protein